MFRMIHIRDAQIEDLPRIVEIYNESVRGSAATFDLKETNVESRKAWFSHYGREHPLIVAEVDGIVAGYCSLSRFRDKEAYRRTVESSVYIDSAYHGRGIGKQLMQEILRRAAALSHHVVVAGITDGNATSVKLHLGLGFEFVGCFKEVGYKFNQWQDVHFYQLTLEN